MTFCTLATSTRYKIGHTVKTTDSTGIKIMIRQNTFWFLIYQSIHHVQKYAFIGAKSKYYFLKWKESINGKERLQTVWGLKLEFSSDAPKITVPSYSSIFQTRWVSHWFRSSKKGEKIKYDCESSEYILLMFKVETSWFMQIYPYFEKFIWRCVMNLF